MKVLFKLSVVSVFGLLLVACATSSDMQSVEQLVIEGQENVIKLDQQITQLQTEKAELAKQLNAVDNSVSQAIEIKEKISLIDSNISSYQSEIKVLNAQMAANSNNIAIVKKQQKIQHIAAADAIKENEALKLQAIEEIKALERDYAQKRESAKENNKEDK